MAVRVFDKKRGKEVTLLNPSEKGKKYACELQTRILTTNDGDLIKDPKGNPKRMSDTQAAWRSGYLKARKDNAKCYKAKKSKSE